MGLLKNIKNVLHKVGLTKENLGKVAPIISVVNPIAGLAATAFTSKNPADIWTAMAGAVVGNLITKNPGGIFSAQGRLPALTDALKNIVKNPTKLVSNTVAAGGDIGKALVSTLGGMGIGSNQLGGLSDIISNGSGSLNLSNFGLDDALGIYSIVQYLREKPEEPPTPALYQHMDEPTLTKLKNAFGGTLDESTKKAIEKAQENANARGVFRSGMLGAQESELTRLNALEKANYGAKVDESGLKYNNTLTQQENTDKLNKYKMIAAQKMAEKEALGNLAAGYATGTGIFQKQNQANPYIQSLNQTSAATTPTVDQSTWDSMTAQEQQDMFYGTMPDTSDTADTSYDPEYEKWLDEYMGLNQ